MSDLAGLIAEIRADNNPCHPCDDTCSAWGCCQARSIDTLLAALTELVAENAKYREAYWRARACGSVETCNAECWDCSFPPREDD